MDLKNKVALVTGAGRRIGRAIALELAARGASIAVHYRTSHAEADGVVAGILANGGKAQAFRTNLERVAEIERMVAEVLDAFGRIDILVNSASVFAPTPLNEITELEWNTNLDTNLKAPFFLAKFAGTAMRRQGAGKIINLADWAGIRPYKDYLPYSVSRSGLIGLTKALAKELAPEVQVNCIALGLVMPPEKYTKDEVDRLVARTLTKKLGTLEDVTRAVIFFCETDFATGSVLTLEGGRLLV
ncbi:MAG: SDR family NAD(P)-dependent oxidoreductase [Candidatus Binatus sp.]|uniref:SDR family NAD(P)-dependent oxidoreductase n=1 Tax=Candidatus Binatus sp. TaxID=2811406 RepID=UPI003C753A9A